ncbi:hypothetical protein GGR51DRAFT_517121 [Nemania sp. FL0031]|nr:hypothetical protein GGR51DRAFT_517121 [Nemania sp. FL0031]
MSDLTLSARRNFDTSVAFLVITTLAVIARFGSRLSIRQRPSGPDWLCLLTLVFFYGYCIVIINFIYNVSQFHAFDLDPVAFPLSETKNFLIAVFLIEILFTLVLTSVKLSILWFYRNIFQVNRTTNRVIIAVMIVCIVWFIIALFPLIIFQCNPVDALWNKFDAPPYCLESQKILLGYELSNFFIDIAILSIPVATVGKLQLSRTKKIGTSATFLLGGFVCIASIVRLTTIYDVSDPSKPVQSSPSVIWSTIQAGVAIICSCIPTYGPLFAVTTKSFRSWTSQYNSYGSQANRHGDTVGSSRGRFQDLGDGRSDNWTKAASSDDHGLPTWNSEAGQSNEHILQPLPPRGIVVSRQVDVV